jgi:hypothetical protein
MATIIRNRTLNPTTRQGNLPYKIDTELVKANDTLIVNVDHADNTFKKSFLFDGKSIFPKKSIHFTVNGKGKQISIVWSGAKPMADQRMIFLRTAWMKHYEGVTKTDLPSGAGSYVTKNQDGGEVCNFLPINGYYYGFARIQMGRSLRLERLGASLDEDSLDRVTVVLFAKNPSSGGEFIVGFYKNATLFRNVQNLPASKRLGHPYYLVKAKLSDGRLIDEGERIFELPKDGPGQTNAWYIEQYRDPNYQNRVRSYIENPDAYKRPDEGKIDAKSAWQKDVELRKRIEYTAMDAVATYFSKRGFHIRYVHLDKVGWDLEAKKGNQLLYLEVKDLSGSIIQIEVTPNEYHQCKSNKTPFRFCIVTNALEPKKRKIDVFFHKDGIWQDSSGVELKVKEILSARMFVK